MKELMALARGPADDLSGSKGLEGLRATDSANAGPRWRRGTSSWWTGRRV